MGYRSDVKVLVSRKGYVELKEFVEKESVKFKKSEDGYDFNLLKIADQIRCDGDQVLISWNDVKWYEGCYNDVDLIMDGLTHLDNEGYSYRFYRVGESYDDIEETCIDGDKDPNLDYLWVVRYIEDEVINGDVIDYDGLDNCELGGGE